MIRSVVARRSETREDLPQLVEVGPPGLHGRRVGGVEAPVDQADERLGRQRELGPAFAVLRGHERDLLAGLQGEVPDGAARGHVQWPLAPAGLACPGARRGTGRKSRPGTRDGTAPGRSTSPTRRTVVAARPGRAGRPPLAAFRASAAGLQSTGRDWSPCWLTLAGSGGYPPHT